MATKKTVPTVHKKINATTAMKILDHCGNINGNKNVRTNYGDIVNSHSNEAKHFFSEYCGLIKSGNLTRKWQN